MSIANTIIFLLIISAVIISTFAKELIKLNIKEKEFALTKGGSLLLECTSKSPIIWHIPLEIENIQRNYSIRNNVHNATLYLSNTNYKLVGFYVCASTTTILKPITRLSYLDNLEKEDKVKYIYLFADDTKNLLVPSPSDIKTRVKNTIIIPCRPTSPNAHIQLMYKNQEILIIIDITPVSSLQIPYEKRIGLELNVTLEDDGRVYTCIAKRDGNNEEKKFKIHIVETPKVLRLQSNMFVSDRTPETFICYAKGKPAPNVIWYFKPSSSENQSQIAITEKSSTVTHKYERNPISGIKEVVMVSKLTMVFNESGSIECLAVNEVGSSTLWNNFYISDTDNGFSVSNPNNAVIEGDNVNLTCTISHYFNKSKAHWYKMPENVKIEEDNEDYKLHHQNSRYSTVLTLSIKNITKNHSGEYLCKMEENKKMQNIIYKTSVEDSKTILNVKDGKMPTITLSNLNNSVVKYILGEQNINISCIANGEPKPTLTWFKNNAALNLTDYDEGRIFFNDNGNRLNFKYFKSEDKGTYTCKAINKFGSAHKFITFSVNQSSNSYIYIIVLVLFIIFIIVIIVMARKIKKQKETYLNFYKSGFKHFLEGEIEKINPDLGVDEQAELLPYDKNIEFPRDKLKIGRQLGAGAFGVVMKAIAYGINEGEESTTVAVKTVKKVSDPIIIRTLISELKIMIHLGKHVNIISLLGACTTNIQNDDLLVIVEYCQYGNLHNYLLRHRKNYINQIDSSDNINFNIDSILKENASNNFINSDKTNRIFNSQLSDNGLISRQTTDSTICDSSQPEWRSNFKSDYTYKKTISNTLSTKDLLSWSYQIASGLEYLSGRRILHGDLATRNILLSDNNIVKICDFGLAKRMYKAHDYKKKGNTPLPIKWMAIECIRDRIFSTQSDVWAYGIVLWEIFTLGSTPYPGMEADENLYKSLIDGYRMKQPEFANKILYNIMLECWRANALQRPTFQDLVSRFTQLIDNETKMYFAEKYNLYTNMNKKWLLTHRNCDLLTAMSSPDYKSFAFLNPKHEYINGPYGGPTTVNPLSPEANDSNYVLNRTSLLNIEALNNNKKERPKIPDEYIEMFPKQTTMTNKNNDVHVEIKNNDSVENPFYISSNTEC